ncbi:MAG: hypothetical protein AAGD38_14165 [Acidobacteriota bacterium]
MKETFLLRAQWRVEYGAYWLIERFLRSGSHARARRFGRRLGGLAHRLLGSRVKRAEDNLAIAFPDADAATRRAWIRECFANYGSYYCEIVSAGRFAPADVDETFEVRGWEHMEAAQALGKGVLIMSGHFGHSELGIYPTAVRLGSLAPVWRPLDNPWLAKAADKTRERYNIQWISKFGVGLQLIRALKRGATPVVVIDQRVQPKDGVQVPFFGRPAWTSPLLAIISMRSGAPVVPMYCRARGDDGYVLDVRPMILPEGRAKDRHDQIELTRRYTADTEAVIREHPALWLWMHRRWRHGDEVVADEVPAGNDSAGEVA